MFAWAKEGGREGYRERVREREGNREREKREINTIWEGSINGPSIMGRVGLTLKLDKLLWPSMTFEVILLKMKYLRIHNFGIHINFYQNRFINELTFLITFLIRSTYRHMNFILKWKPFIIILDHHLSRNNF